MVDGGDKGCGLRAHGVQTGDMVYGRKGISGSCVCISGLGEKDIVNDRIDVHCPPCSILLINKTHTYYR